MTRLLPALYGAVLKLQSSRHVHSSKLFVKAPRGIICVLLMSSQFRAEIQDAETGKGEETLRCRRGIVSSAVWCENLSPGLPHHSPSFSRPGRLEAALVSAPRLPGYRLPRDPCSVFVVPRCSAGTVAAMLWSLLFLNFPGSKAGCKCHWEPGGALPGFACFKISVISPSAYEPGRVVMLQTSAASVQHPTPYKTCLQLTLHLNPGWSLALRDGHKSFPEDAWISNAPHPSIFVTRTQEAGFCDLIKMQT